MLSIKSGPYGARLMPPMAIMFLGLILKEVMDEYDAEAEVSGGIEGEHQVGSLHYIGHAVDVAVRNNKPKDTLKLIFEALNSRLGDDFDVVPYYDNAVFHVEFQPKKPFGRLPA